MNDLLDSTMLTRGEGPLTMSSLEIAELTGKRHDHVMRDIRGMLDQLSKNTERETASSSEVATISFEESKNRGLDTAPSFGASYHDSTGRTLPCFRLPKRECIILVSGYDVGMRARIIDRWMELEAQAAKPIDPMKALNDPAWMRGALLTYTEKVIELQAEVDEMRPAVAAHERLIDAHGSLCITDAAKNLQVPPQVLFRWLRTNGWIYKRVGTSHDVGYQSKIQAGYLVHKIETYEKSDGTDGTRTQVRVTPRGMTVLSKAFPAAVSAVSETKSSRRSVVAGIGALVVAAAGALLPSTQVKASMPAVISNEPTGAHRELLDRYIAFLAHEHRAALNERYPGFRDWTGQWHDPQPPMMWIPDAPDVEAVINAELPSLKRAPAMLAGFDPHYKKLQRFAGGRQS